MPTSTALENLITRLTKLPGIGRKSAQRVAFYLLKRPKEEAFLLAEALRDVKEKVRTCSVCANITEDDPCPICRDPGRDRSTICVVEEINDVAAFDRTGEYRGLFHVLGGALSPLDGIGPDELKIKELLTRISGGVKEVIVATNPNVEGEATAVYLAKVLKPLGIKVTRIARGVPVGGALEFADQVTLTRSLEGRLEL